MYFFFTDSIKFDMKSPSEMSGDVPPPSSRHFSFLFHRMTNRERKREREEEEMRGGGGGRGGRGREEGEGEGDRKECEGHEDRKGFHDSVCCPETPTPRCSSTDTGLLPPFLLSSLLLRLTPLAIEFCIENKWNGDEREEERDEEREEREETCQRREAEDAKDDGREKRDVMEKKKRHWAAWSLKETEGMWTQAFSHDASMRGSQVAIMSYFPGFFVALKKHGRNFEAIASSVKTKNRKQIRDYFYRSLKRIDSLLAAEGLSVCFDIFHCAIFTPSSPCANSLPFKIVFRYFCGQNARGELPSGAEVLLGHPQNEKSS